MKPEETRRCWNEELDELGSALSTTPTLARIFDKQWIKETQQAIASQDLPKIADFAPLLFDFYRAKRWLPAFDERLASFSALPFKPKAVSRKMRDLKANRSRPQLRELVFELFVLGSLALEGVLKDVEVQVPDHTIDGQIVIDNRPVYVEITLSTKEVLPRKLPSAFPVGAISLGEMAEPVQTKLRKKRGQLSSVSAYPTILVIGRNFRGTDSLAAEWITRFCFQNPDFEYLSAAIDSDSWRFIKAKCLFAERPRVPLSDKEKHWLQDWVAKQWS
jgi:hypothetical protein